MKTELMQRALRGSEAGELRFPEVIGMLQEAGVESYQVDFLRGDDTFYLPDGRIHAEAIPVGEVAAEFSRDGVVDAIRGAQADRIRYPEFVRRILNAGVAAYRVHLTGKRAVYVGRKGEMHVEEFPKPAN
jgi:uncharacterized protein YbcV (DUF1398 family)